MFFSFKIPNKFYNSNGKSFRFYMSNAFLHKQETNCVGKEKETKEEKRKEKGESPMQDVYHDNI